tara:strand:+ start:6806 stop:7234 length:429 start_codon:yes stop_codon:yes gene_type:complete
MVKGKKSQKFSIFHTSNNMLKFINNNKLIAGLGMIVLNLYSKYVVFDLSKSQQEFIKNTLTREIMIFLVAFVGTRDIILSLALTAIFIVLSSTVFNEKSKLCIIPKKYRQIEKIIDKNKDGNISKEEIRSAIDVLNRAKLNF